MKKYNNYLLVLWMVLLQCLWFTTSIAQFQNIEIGINGLTCSQCSRTVYNALSKVEGVKSIEMDLNHPVAYVSLSPNAKIRFEDLQGAVVNAGYKVRDFYFQVSDVSAWEDVDGYRVMPPWILGGIEDIEQWKDGVRLQIMDPKFMSDKSSLKTLVKIDPPKAILAKGYNYYQVRIVDK